ncbi:carboxylate--amine ligase [Streptomyces sp. 4N509B]|uniref:carboxylate--amine ligase n=1 Tax=Streptomyces sp. 4N509B TaxID=3457413 RepID=UPI003FD19C9B
MPETLDAAVPALLLRVDRNPFHHGSLGAVRSLGRAGVEVHACVESPRVPLARSRYLRGAHPMAPRADGALERALLRAADRIGRPAVLIPMDDAGAIAVARLAHRLRGRFLVSAQPRPGLVERMADKAELADVCARLGIAHPPTVVPGSAAEAVSATRELGLPLVAKWSRPWLLPAGEGGDAPGLRSTTFVTTAVAARALYERGVEAGAAGEGNRLLLQRRLPAGPAADWFFHGCFSSSDASRDTSRGSFDGLFDGSFGGAPGGAPGGHRLLLGGTGVKELAWPVGAGLTALGRWLPNTAVARAAHLLAAHVGYVGVLDLDFRRDAATGDYHLLDVNPRPGAQFRLFTDRSGLDVVRALHLDLTGRRVPTPEPVPGRVFVAENYGLLSGAVAAWRGRGRRGLPRWGRPVETAWFAADDPSPFWAMAYAWGPGRAAGRVTGPVTRRGAARPASQASSRASSRVTSRSTGRAASRDTSRTTDRTTDRITSRITNRRRTDA